MVNFSNYLKNTNSIQQDNNLPLLNSLFVERFSELNPYSKDNDFKTYISWARKSPHVMGLINIIATDMISDDIEFTPLDSSRSGRNKIKKAKEFWYNNNGIQLIEEIIYDLLINGIGYMWIGAISDNQLKENIKYTLLNAQPGIEKKELELKADVMLSNIKKEKSDTLVKKIRPVAASTMTINTDETDVISYVQRVGVNIRRFDKDEILTFMLLPLDGKVYPYPPMEAILSEVYLLWLITQNNVSFFENGGKPDNVFILPKELAGSKNHQYLIDTLKKYKKIQNKHGNLVFTGDLTIEKLMEVDQQMENKDLGLYLVGIIAMLYGIPVSRIPFLVGKAASGGDAGGLADKGYWNKISVWQSKIEAELNSRLWIPYFGVEFEFRRGYLLDEVRETQNDIQKTTVAEQRLRLGLWTVEKAGEYLDIDIDDVEEAQAQKKTRDEEEMKTGLLMQNLNKDKNVIPNPDKQKKAAVKSETQLKNKQEKKEYIIENLDDNKIKITDCN